MKGNKGITLIALVITIIVLLILAGVSIAMLSGDNSILRNAQAARDNSAAGTLDETVKLAVGNIMTANLGWPTVTVTGTTSTSSEDAKSKDLPTQITIVNPGLVKADAVAEGKFKIEEKSAEPKWEITAMINGKTQTVKVDSSTGAVTK